MGTSDYLSLFNILVSFIIAFPKLLSMVMDVSVEFN